MKNYIFLLVLSVFVVSCARVGSPVGGDRDSIAPSVIGGNIDSTRVGVSRNVKELRIDFDEYIMLKDINKNLIISPPIKKVKKILPSNLGTKFLLIKWEDTLLENTTYNFNFGNAITDLNEGNVKPYFNFAFSTGDKIDDLYISGELTDAMGEKRAEAKDGSYVVGLYQLKDSMDYRQKPYYITNVDPDGYYELNFLSPGQYKIIAFEDKNFNSILDNGKEKVAFSNDAINIVDKSISGYNLKLFPPKPLVKYKEMKEVPGGILVNYEGKPQNVKVISKNDNIKDFRYTHKPNSDSINIWFDALSNNIGIDKSENLKFQITTPIKTDSVSLFYKFNSKSEFTISNKSQKIIAPNANYTVVSNFALDKIDASQWKLVSDSIAQPFNADIAKDNPYLINITSDYKPGKKYQLTIAKESVESFYTKLPKAYRLDFEVGRVEDYGSFAVSLLNKPSKKFWIQLIDSNDEVAKNYYGNNDKVSFNQLLPGNYTLRILVDNNENGIWETSDFTTQTYGEDVYLFRKNKDLNPMTKINIRPMWEINESWDLKLPLQN